MTDTDDAETQFAEGLFRPFNRAELLRRDFGVIRNSRGQARRRRLVPGGQPRLVRQRPDLGLGEPGLVERAEDAELPRGLPARAVVAPVVGVAAVGDGCESALARERR